MTIKYYQPKTTPKAPAKGSPKSNLKPIKAYLSGPRDIAIITHNGKGTVDNPYVALVDEREPILRLCRVLTELEDHYNHYLEVYRKGTLVTRIDNILAIGKLTVVENSGQGPFFGKYREVTEDHKARLKALPRKDPRSASGKAPA